MRFMFVVFVILCCVFSKCGVVLRCSSVAIFFISAQVTVSCEVMFLFRHVSFVVLRCGVHLVGYGQGFARFQSWWR